MRGVKKSGHWAAAESFGNRFKSGENQSEFLQSRKFDTVAVFESSGLIVQETEPPRDHRYSTSGK